MKKITCLAAFGLSLVGCANGFDTYNINPGVTRYVNEDYVYVVRVYKETGDIKTVSGLSSIPFDTVEAARAMLSLYGYKLSSSTRFRRDGTEGYAEIINYTTEKVISFDYGFVEEVISEEKDVALEGDYIVTYRTFIEVYNNGKLVPNSAYEVIGGCDTYKIAYNHVTEAGFTNLPGTNTFTRGQGATTYIVLNRKAVGKIHR